MFDTRAGHALTKPYCHLGSIKANIGHTMSAAGVAGFIKAVLAIQQGVIPPQPSVETPNPELELDRSPFRLAGAALPWERSRRIPGAPPYRASASAGPTRTSFWRKRPTGVLWQKNGRNCFWFQRLRPNCCPGICWNSRAPRKNGRLNRPRCPTRLPVAMRSIAGLRLSRKGRPTRQKAARGGREQPPRRIF